MKFNQLTTNYAAGIDLHKSSIAVHILSKNGISLYQKTIKKNMRRGLKRVLLKYKGDITVCVESTYNWYWIADLCLQLNIPFEITHAFYAKKKMIGKNKNDGIDAAGLARMLLHEELPVAYNYPPEMRATRDLLRLRASLKKMRTGRLQHHSCVEDQYLMSEISLEEAGYNEETIKDITTNMGVDEQCIDFLTTQIIGLEKHILARADVHDEDALVRLKKINGIGDILALTLLYEIHTIDRFKSQQEFSSYCRVVNPQCESAGKRVGSGNKKAGNHYLNWAMHGIATYSCRYNERVKEYFEKLKRKKGKKNAKRILTHKWAIVIYNILKKRIDFDIDKFLKNA
jgi:transposase